MSKLEILEKTMREMPDIFTSNNFSKIASLNGYPTHLLGNKGLGWFIKRYAYNEDKYSKTWTKKTFRGFHKKDPPPDLITDAEMIIHLKSKGYKIMKPVNEWIEC